MAEKSVIREFFGGIASNAAWEWIKTIGGGLMVSLVSAVTQYLQHRPADWWGILGLGITTSVIFAILVRWSNPKSTKLSSNKPTSVNLIESNKLTDDIFTPLQIEAFCLAHKLNKLAQWPGGSLTRLIVDKIFTSPEHNEWARKTVATYALDFAWQVKEIELRFEKEYGIEDLELRQYFEFAPDVKSISRIAVCVVCLAHRKNGISVMPRSAN
jgi:hypothetical protein